MQRLLFILILSIAHLLLLTNCKKKSSDDNVTPSTETPVTNSTTPPTVTPDTSKYPTFQTYLPKTGNTSGLVYTDGALWTQEDGGTLNAIYKIDTSSANNGKVLQTVFIKGFANNDWEDLAADADYIYIGDFGNNNGNRSDLNIIKVKKSDIGTGAVVQVNASAIYYSYPDQPASEVNSPTVIADTDFDCETVFPYGDSLYIMTKRKGDHHTRLYSVPKTPGTYVAHFIVDYNSNGKITGGDINPEKNTIILCGYQGSHGNPFVYELKNWTGTNFFNGTIVGPKLLSPVSSVEWQVEGVTFTNTSRIWLSNENIGASTPNLVGSSSLWKTTLYRLFKQ